jgi:hypothetical protein
MSVIRTAIVSALAIVSLLGGGLAAGRYSQPHPTRAVADEILCCDYATNG